MDGEKGPDERLKAEFGYDGRKGVGACDRGPSGLSSSFSVPRSKPGTQCHTSATSLRKQISKLRVSDPRHGAVYKDVHGRQPDTDVRFAGNPAPQRQELTRVVCSAS